MWIAPSIRLGLGIMSVSFIWLTPCNESRTNTVRVVDGVTPAAASARLPDVGEPSFAPGATLHSFTFRTDEDAALVRWALARFEAAGLELPELVLAFHDDRHGCNGHPGFYQSGTPARVHVCDRFPTPDYAALKGRSCTNSATLGLATPSATKREPSFCAVGASGHGEIRRCRGKRGAQNTQPRSSPGH